MPDIETWLKTTIPGIVLLGAFGSVSAILLLKLLSYLSRKAFHYFSRLAPAVAQRVTKWTFKHIARFYYRQAYELGYSSGGGIAALVVYFALHLSRIMLWLGLALFFGTSAVTMLITTKTTLLRAGTYSLIVLAMVSFVYACHHAYKITMAYRQLPEVSVETVRYQRDIERALDASEGSDAQGPPSGSDQSPRPGSV